MRALSWYPLTDDLCRLCTPALHTEVGGIIQRTWFKRAVHSAEGCCAATTMALNSIFAFNKIAKFDFPLIIKLGLHKQ